MRVVVIASAVSTTNGLTRAGVALYGAKIVEALARARPNCEIWVYIRQGVCPPPEWDLPNIRVKYLPKRYYRWIRTIAPFTWKLAKVDVVFAVSIPTIVTPLLPVVTMIHDLFQFKYPEYFPDDSLQFERDRLQEACQSSTIVVCNSHSTKSDVQNIFAVDRDSVLVTHLGPGHPIADQKKDSGISSALGNYIFTLSTVEPRKNLARLIEAFAKVLESSPAPDLNLVVGGAKGWKVTEIFDTVSRLGLENRVQFLGYVEDDDLAELYRGAKVYVCASIEEGFGLPLLEAMLAGARCISSNGGALTEVGGQSVETFDPTSVESIAEAMLTVLNESPEARSTAIQSHGLQAKTFGWEQCATATWRALELAVVKRSK